ncbi:MAG: phage tail tape measure protein, partial [Sulfitobacter sp.]
MKFSMIFSAIDKSSKVIGKIIGNVDRLKGAASTAVKASATAVKTTAKGVVLAGGLMSAALAGSANEAIAFESAMADVNKVVEFESPAGFEKFSSDILDMTTRIPVAARGLAEISAEAGAAGIALEDNLRFTEFTAKSAVAFDFAASRAGESFAKIRNVYQLSQTGIEGMADAVNHLSNNMASKAPEIVDFINRAGGAAPMLKASAVEMAAIGSAMIATGTAPEVAARGITTLATKLEVGGKKVEGALKAVGLTHKGLMAQIETNPGEGLITLFEAIKNSPKGTEALKDLVGQDFVDDFAKITSRSDLLAASLRLVGDET